MVVKLLIQGIIVLLLWVGGWGIAEMAVDSIAGDDKPLRLTSYFIFLLFGILLLVLLDRTIPD